jgi:hypothetical protein
MFKDGDHVVVTGGEHVGDYGVVVAGPVRVGPQYAYVNLERAGRRCMVPVSKLELRPP